MKRQGKRKRNKGKKTVQTLKTFRIRVEGIMITGKRMNKLFGMSPV